MFILHNMYTYDNLDTPYNPLIACEYGTYEDVTVLTNVTNTSMSGGYEDAYINVTDSIVRPVINKISLRSNSLGNT